MYKTLNPFTFTYSFLSSLLFFALITTLPAQVLSSDSLSEKEVQALISGNTSHLEIAGKGQAKSYMSPDGKVTLVKGKNTMEGEWTINEKGALCVHYTGKPKRCGTVHKDGDSSYIRTDDANITYLWKKVTKGNGL
jgi:hypothetical protein